ncbi:MAG: hypothetical protein [Bacteriophage sp.]|nr:MAG: hypothetical protein [Bacteriophage sp.]
MKVTNLIQSVGSSYIDAAKHHMASIAEITDVQRKNTSINSVVDSINQHMFELDKVPGKELIDCAKYQGAAGNLYLVTQDELDQFVRLFNEVLKIIPVHGASQAASFVKIVQELILEIKKD